MGTGLAGVVDLAPALRTGLPKDASVIVSAYAVDGPRLPVARKVLAADRWPVAFTLGDADAVNPAFVLSKAVQVVLVARVSSAPTEPPRSGDLEGRSVPMASGAKGVSLRIDRRIP